MKTMEELTQMKMDRLVLETTMEMILCMFESCDTEEFTEILGKLLGGKQTSKVTAHLEALEELLTEEEYSSFLAEYLGYLTVNVAEFIRSTIIENGLMLLAGSGGEEDNAFCHARYCPACTRRGRAESYWHAEGVDCNRGNRSIHYTWLNRGGHRHSVFEWFAPHPFLSW